MPDWDESSLDKYMEKLGLGSEGPETTASVTKAPYGEHKLRMVLLGPPGAGINPK